MNRATKSKERVEHEAEMERRRRATDTSGDGVVGRYGGGTIDAAKWHRRVIADCETYQRRNGR